MKVIGFQDNLRELRKQKQCTQAELGALVGVDQRTVSAWEKGVCEPSYTTLAKLCDLFDESFDDILT